MATANTYKNGAVGVTKAIEIVCRIYRRYGPKLLAVIDAAYSESRITSAQHDAAVAFLSSIQATCDIFRLITGY